MHLLYFADPMCSWCYGFGPQLVRLLEAHPDAHLDLVMGGLRAFNREPATAPFREELAGHWAHVREASGLPFNEAALAREGFVYDTEPACRAVVNARLLDAAREPQYFHAVQAAFYRDARDVTLTGVLADIAAECGFARDEFASGFESEATREETNLDFSTTRTLKIGGFPTLGLARGDQLYLVTVGFVTTDVLEERIARIEALPAAEAGGERA